MRKKLQFLSIGLLLISTGVSQEAQKVDSTSVSSFKVVGANPFPNPKAMFLADGTPNYSAYYRDFVGYSADHFFGPNSEEWIKKSKEIQIGQTVMGLCWLARVTGDRHYLERAHDIFGILLGYADHNPAVINDCFGYYETLDAALMLKEAGSFDPAWEPILRRFTQEGVSRLNRNVSKSDGNQDLARKYGCLLAQKLYPDMPEAVSAAGKVNDAFTEILKQGDLYTDSSNYFGVSLTFFIQIAHELGREQEIAKSPGFHRMFVNFAGAVSPNGYLPAWGSGYFTPNCYNYTPLFLEYAAALYQDPALAAAGRRYYGQLIQAGPARAMNPREANHNMMAINLPILDLFKPLSNSVSSPEFISGITRRNGFIGGEVPGFLIMRPSLNPGAPMVMMDLLSQGDHCMREFSASIAYYESDHVPLFYQYGRHVDGASRGNQVIFGDLGALEPYSDWKEDVWRTVSIPASRFVHPDGTTSIDTIWLRTDGSKKDSGVILDHMRLVGSGGTKPVSDLTQWKGNSHSATEGKNPGSQGIKILDDGTGVTVKDFKPLTFDPNQYQELQCDVKWFGKARPKGQLRLGEGATWTALEDSLLLTQLKDAQVDCHGEDSHARIEYSVYGTFDSKLVRQIVLTKEGVLAIRDDIVPGASADGRPAFSLWQMYSIDDTGAHRFSSRGECSFVSRDLTDAKKYRRGMSAYFSGPDGMQSGKQVIPKGRLANSLSIQRDTDLRTTYARVDMKSGQPTYLNLLVVPHPENQDFEKLDAVTSMTQDTEKSSFKTVCDGVPVSIEMNRNGTWSVSRSSATPSPSPAS